MSSIPKQIFVNAQRAYAHARIYAKQHPHVTQAVLLALCAAIVTWYFIFVYVPPNTIVLREDGFHPTTITVAAGETITFRNDRGKYFWPASDFHPTHELYPAFDSKEPLAPGATYSFTFTEPGLYPFHDHLAAFFFGVIKVQGKDGNVPQNCSNSKGGSFSCWQNQIFLALAEHGVGVAYDEVARLYSSEPEFARSCHYIAHNIGLASYQYYVKGGDKIFSANAIVCAGGFYHGFMEGLLGATGSPEKAGKVCDRIGDKVGKLSPDSRLQCYHGIGHGAIETAVATLGASSVDGMVAEAIRMCERSSKGTEERYRCVSGAYNGVSNFYIAEQYGLSLSTSDPRLLCARQPEVYKEPCYGELNSIARILGKDDLAAGAAWMLAIPDAVYKSRAMEYLSGMYAVDHVGDSSVEVLARACEQVAPEYRTDCHVGSLRGLIEHGTPGEEYKQVFAYCAYNAFTTEQATACYERALANLTSWYGPEKMRTACMAAPEAMQKFCQ